MPDRLSILCVHGIGHGDRDPLLVPSWTSAIEQDLHRWNPDLEVEFEFLRYDNFFSDAALTTKT
jgi:metacaspase-1